MLKLCNVMLMFAYRDTIRSRVTLRRSWKRLYSDDTHCIEVYCDMVVISGPMRRSTTCGSRWRTRCHCRSQNWSRANKRLDSSSANWKLEFVSSRALFIRDCVVFMTWFCVSEYKAWSTVVPPIIDPHFVNPRIVTPVWPTFDPSAESTIIDH